MIPLKYNVKNLFVRWQSTAMTVFGVGLVVCVFTLMAALGHGFSSTLQKTGHPLNLMVLRQGAQTETTSFVGEDKARIMETLPGIEKNAAGLPMASPERVVFINQLKRGAKSESEGSNLVMRGVTERAFDLHPAVRVVEGRLFRPGVREVIVSRRIAERFEGCGLGETLRVGARDWSVVGVFEAPGSSFASEIWADLDVVQQEFFLQDTVSSVVIRARDEAALAGILAEVTEKDPRLKLAAKTEPEYYAAQTTSTAQQLYFMGVFIAVIMSVGAVFGAMNTMYAAVAARRREIATMRAMGFRRRHILLSFIAESSALGLLGGVLGVLMALPVNGYSTGTTNWDTFTEVVFAFQISPTIAMGGLVFAVVMGFAGGLLPAWNACRSAVASGLRAV